MAAGEEIDLTGLEKQIEAVDKQIVKLSEDADTMGNKLREPFKKLESLMREMPSKISKASLGGLENSGKAVKNFTDVLEKLAKISERSIDFKNINTEKFDAILDRSSKMFSYYENQVKAWSDSARSEISKVLMSFEDIVKLPPLKITAKSSDIIQLRQDLIDAESQFTELLKVMRGGNLNLMTLTQIKELNKRIDDAKNKISTIKDELANADKNNAEFVNQFKDVVTYITTAKNEIDRLKAKLSDIDKYGTGVSTESADELQAKVDILEKLVAPYEELRDERASELSMILENKKALADEAEEAERVAKAKKESAEVSERQKDVEIAIAKAEKEAVDEYEKSRIESAKKYEALQKKFREAQLEYEKARKKAAKEYDEFQQKQARKRRQEQEELNKLLLQGSEKGIIKYLEQGKGVNRLIALIEKLRIAQSRLNDGTAKGKKEAERVGATIDLIQKRVDKLQGTYTRFNELFGKTKNIAGQVAMSLGVMGGVFGAVNLIRNVYRITSEFELQQKALAAITQNAREANILFKQMQTLATNSPLKLMDLNRYAKQLAAYRIETNNLYDSLKMLGDISVGVGVDMDRLILAYGQVKAANYLRGQELRQFSEAGVNILGGLQEYYKETKNISMSINEIFDSVSKRKVLFEDVDAVLHRMTEAGGAFFNMQLIQSQTLYGQYQKLGDMFQINMNKVGESTSGILMAMIKIAQALISNLRVVLNIIVGIASAKGVYALYQSLYKANLVSKDLRLSLSGASKNMRQLVVWGQMLTRLQFGKLVASLRRAASTASSLGMAIRGVAAGIATIAFTTLFTAFQNARQRAKELSDEILEMNKRYGELKKVSDDFSRATDFKSQRIELQKLVEKAKEYKYNLTLPAKITPDNISDAFKNAAEQLRYYIQQTQYYTTQFNTNVLQKRVADLNQTLSDYSVAQKSANDLYEKYLLDFSKLSEEEQRIVLDLQTKREEYRLDEKAAAEKYGEDRIAFERNFVREIASIRRGYLFGNEIYESVGDWKTYNKALQNVDEFEKEYERKLDKAFKSINRHAKLANLAKNISGLEGDELEKRLIKEIPPIINSLSQLGDFAKSDIIRKISEALDKDYSTVATAYVKYENGSSDINDDDFKKLMTDFIANDKVMQRTMNVKVNFEFPEDILPNVAEQIGDVYGLKAGQKISQNLAEEIDKEISNIFTSGKTIDEIKKSSDQLVKDYREYLSLYNKASSVANNKELGPTALASANEQAAKSFDEASEGVQYYTLALEKLSRMYRANNWDLPKIKGGGRGKSYVEEYQSMIDFIKRLNEEYDKLRQNFSEKVSYDKIVKNFEESFADMPQEFKDKFGELQNIIFQSKLGTAEGEKLVKEIIEASGKLKPDEIAKLRRNVQQYIDQLEAEFNVEVKIKDDERLKAQVQKMFDDYNLTIELEKLGVDADEVGKLFNIDTKDLLTLENKLESMKEKFVGRNMEKEYRQFMRKIVEINDKANLEMAKKYVKYMREEYSERAKVELEYMRKRAEVYALPFDEDETMRILDNLQKETKKKLDEIDWKTFTGSDTYIELFEDLSKASVSSMDYMIDQLKVLKSSLSSLDPSNLKTIVDQIEKLEDELIKRDPFKVLSDSMKSWRDFRKDEKMTSLINEILGNDSDAKINDFRNTLNKAIEEAKKKVDEARNKVNLQNALFGAAKQRDEAANWAVENIEGINWDNVYNLGGMQRALKEIEEERDKLSKRINAQKLIGVTSEEGLSGDEKLYLKYSKYAEYISKVVSALEALQKTGDKYTSASDLEKAWKDANGDLEQFLKNLKELESGKRSFDKIGDAAIEAGKQLADMASNMKNAYTSINEYLDSIGIATGAVGEAWKELGSTMFDTIIQALQMIPQMVASIVSAETAINAAAGWIGLIAEAITLVMGLAKSLAGLHDAYKQEEIDRLQKSFDRLEKTANELDEAFDDLFDEDRLRAFDAALIKTRELEIATLEAMMAAEKAKKKSDQTVIDGYQDQIDSLNDELQEGIDKFYESLGGFGSEANMKSMAESWTDAWLDAYKETGDGLQGLEDSFDEFIDNLYKKTILNKLSEKYFKDLYTQLDSILATEGGLTNNLDAFNDWIGLVQNAFDGFNEDATAAMNALSNVYGAGGGLEGLQASLQGMTEETADILAAYLNSVRFYVADNNQLLQNLYNVMAIDNDANPMLQQLKIIAAQTTAIHNVFDSVVSFGGDVSGNFVKVKISQ